MEISLYMVNSMDAKVTCKNYRVNNLDELHTYLGYFEYVLTEKTVE